jgi:hypothetical protein
MPGRGPGRSIRNSAAALAHDQYRQAAAPGASVGPGIRRAVGQRPSNAARVGTSLLSPVPDSACSITRKANVAGPERHYSSSAGSERRFGLAPPVAVDPALPTQTTDERLRGRPSRPKCGHPTSAPADSERRFGFAARVVPGLGLPSQTSHAHLQGRPCCPTSGHPTLIAGHGIAAQRHLRDNSTIPHLLPDYLIESMQDKADARPRGSPAPHPVGPRARCVCYAFSGQDY